MKTAAALLIGMLLGGAGVWLNARRTAIAPRSNAVGAVDPLPPVVAAAQGRVEGRTENIEVEASMDGVIRSLLVREGQKVGRGEVIGEIGCENLDSDVRALEALRESARQSRVRLLRGAREEERRVAAENVRAAQAIVEQAQRQNERMQYLARKDDVPQQAAENAKRDLETARAAFDAALEKQKLANAGPLPEEVTKADAEVAAAEEKLAAAVALRQKCFIRAPIAGTVTRVDMRVGEAFSTVVPRPIVTMADLTGRRIRAEVDERDVARIQVNQKVRISAGAVRDPFGGKVVWTSMVMGRKTARSTDPAEKSDRDILEALIVPDRDAPVLPVGFRVTVEFLHD